MTSFFARPQPQSFYDELGLEIPTVPLQLLFYVMLVFVIVIGPVNFLVLRKFRKEPLILLTSPAVSLLFCLLVVGFITLNEGWYSRAKAFGVTLLDQEGRQAATLARLGVYAPMHRAEVSLSTPATCWSSPMRARCWRMWIRPRSSLPGCFSRGFRSVIRLSGCRRSAKSCGLRRKRTASRW